MKRFTPDILQPKRETAQIDVYLAESRKNHTKFNKPRTTIPEELDPQEFVAQALNNYLNENKRS